MRLIDADAFEANMQNEWERNEISNGEWIRFREMINEEPTIGERKKGRWLRKENEWNLWYECSICGEKAPRDSIGRPWDRSDYCPNCGSYNGGEER